VPEKFGPRIVVWLGPNRHSMLYPVRRDLFNLSGFVPAEEVHREVWAPSPDTEDLRRSFVGACDDVTSLIERADEALITPIYFRDPLDSWGTERVALLGDAAHPSPPSAGMGAAMALEDAVVLARCIERHADGAAAFADYASLRMTRTRRMLVSSRNNLAFFNEPDPAQMRGRNGRFIGMQRLDPVGETGTGWLYEYDAATAAQAAPAPVPVPLRRPAARRAADLWRNALTLEDRAGLWRGERAGYDRFLRLVCPSPEDVEVEPLACEGVAALRIVPPAGRADGPVVLHLHGGGFVLGSARSSIALAARLAAAVGGWTLVPDYRLAPENPFPVPLDDVHTAYRWLLEQSAGEIALSGECAGGALAVSLAVRLRDEGTPLPVAIHAVSPFCDLTVSSASTTTGSDPWFNRDILRLYAASYLHDAEPLSPLVSPVHADLRELPPLLIHVAADEALLDDAVALARTAEEAGVDVRLRTVADSVHSFVLFEFLPEADEALAAFSALVSAASARVH
jgi:salicylate hydroxylase